MSNSKSKQLSQYEALLIDLAKQPPPSEADKNRGEEIVLRHNALNLGKAVSRALRREKIALAGTLSKAWQEQTVLWIAAMRRNSGKLPNKANKPSRFNTNWL